MSLTIAVEPALDGKRYGRLLAKFAPKIIETEEENGAALAIVEGLMEYSTAAGLRKRTHSLRCWPR